MRRALARLLGALLVLSAGAPAGAGIPEADAGAGTGVMRFGKTLECDHHGGTGAPGGAGMPFSPLSPPKRAWARFDADVTSASTQTRGHVALCARLGPIASNVRGGVGATCDLSKGHTGRGRITWSTQRPTVWLDELTWKVSLLTTNGTYYVVTGRARSDHADAYPKGKGKPDPGGTFLALLEAQAAGCFFDGPTKGSKDSPQEGHHESPGFVVFVVLPAGPAPHPSQVPVLCKESAATCAYGPKD